MADRPTTSVGRAEDCARELASQAGPGANAHGGFRCAVLDDAPGSGEVERAVPKR